MLIGPQGSLLALARRASQNDLLDLAVGEGGVEDVDLVDEAGEVIAALCGANFERFGGIGNAGRNQSSRPP